jgi:hypothetical protein
MVSGAAFAQWTSITGYNLSNASTSLLLTDGRVMVHDASSRNWRILTPDAFGSYVNGTWSDAAQLPAGHQPLYYGAAVLPDGRLVISGGEYNDNVSGADQTNATSIFDPDTNYPTGAWTSISPPNGGASPWNQIGDSSGVVFPDGRFAVCNNFSTSIAVLDAVALTWTVLAGGGKADNFTEENGALLPDGTFLLVNCNLGVSGAEKYDIATNTWYSASAPPQQLASSGGMMIAPEMGPTVMRPNGTAAAFGANGLNAVYTPALGQPNQTGSWAMAGSFPSVNMVQVFMADAPACVLQNGNVLCAASGFFTAPTSYFEFGLNTNTMVQVGNPPTINYNDYNVRMLMLPTGQVLTTYQNSEVVVYAATGGIQDAWRPVIVNYPSFVEPNQNYTIAGYKFNGLTEGAYYGDDANMSTNYPLVRITNLDTGHVFYCKTWGHSRMGVETADSTELISTNFHTPAGLESGNLRLEVVANGIPSKALVLNAPTLAYNAEDNLEFGSVCVGNSEFLTLTLFNVGPEDLVVNSITRVSGSNEFSLMPNPGLPVIIQPGSHVDFEIKFAPTSGGAKSAVFRIASNDPNKPTVDVTATGTGALPLMVLSPASVDFGPACPGDVVNQTVTISNASECPMTVSNIGLTGDTANFSFSAPSTPFVIPAGGDTSFQVTFAPTTFFASEHTATVTVTSNASNSPKALTLKGTAPPPVINVAPCPLDFGVVCAEDTNGHFKTIQVCNNGTHCPLTVSNVTVTGPNFQVIGPTSFTVSPGNCVSVTIKFTPTSAGIKNGTITVLSDDPNTPNYQCAVSGTTPLSGLSAIDHLSFPPTVYQNAGNCFSKLPLPIQNNGPCETVVTAISISGANADEFKVVGLSGAFPVVVGAGELLGDGDLAVEFRPKAIARWRSAVIDITFISDPITGGTTTIHVPVVGEGTSTGARALVTIGGVPAAKVDKLQLTRIVGNRNVSNEVLQNVTPTVVVGPYPELSFTYHREWGGQSNPVQILTGNYQLTATVTVGKKRLTKSVYFQLDTCTFNPNVVIAF